MTGSPQGLERGLVLGRYRVRTGQGPEDLAAARAVRAAAFARPDGHDDDPHDALCAHVLVEDTERNELVACFRLAELDPADIETSYAARFYDLSRLAKIGGPLLELGRFCLRPGSRDPDILRLAWAALSAHVDAAGTRLMFGCASFPGAEPERHRPALARLARQHLGPADLRPGARAPRRVALDDTAPMPQVHGSEGLRAIPPLLRTYLAMGGWVGDHAVIDDDMDTLHVFTAVEVASIPPARARSIRAVAARAAPA